MVNELIKLMSDATITLPVLEVTILLVLLAGCLVFKCTRVGLVIAYLFIYRWGWLFFTDRGQNFLLSYLVLGCVVGILTVVGMLSSPPDS